MPVEVLRVSCPVCDVALATSAPPVAEPRAVLVCPRCDHRWPVAADAADAGPLRCSTHPRQRAFRVCDECGGAWCEACDEDDRSQTVGDLRVSACCLSRRLAVAGYEAPRPFWEDLRSVLAWPLRQAGLPILAMFWIGSFVPLVSWVLLLVLAAYLQHVLRVSARGADHLPAYPEFDDLVPGVIYPLGRFLAVTVVLWFPWWFYRLFLGGNRAWVGALLAIPAVVLWPFGVTVASVGRTLRPLTDLPLLLSVLTRIRVDYAAAVGVLAALAAPVVVLDLASSHLVAGLLASFLRYYALFAGFHVLGRMVRQTRHAVDWDV